MLNLYINVQKLGGYEAVTSWDAWNEIAEAIGYTYQESEEIRIIYIRYLEMIEWYHQKFKIEALNYEEGEASTMENKFKSTEVLPIKKRKINEDFIKRKNKD